MNYNISLIYHCDGFILLFYRTSWSDLGGGNGESKNPSLDQWSDETLTDSPLHGLWCDCTHTLHTTQRGTHSLPIHKVPYTHCPYTQCLYHISTYTHIAHIMSVPTVYTHSLYTHCPHTHYHITAYITSRPIYTLPISHQDLYTLPISYQDSYTLARFIWSLKTGN